MQDINPGYAASSPIEFLQVGPLLYFSAEDGMHGRELWALPLPPARDKHVWLPVVVSAPVP